MTFKPDVNLDPGRVRDSRGRRVRGGGLAVGGGLGTLVIFTAGTDHARVHLHGLDHGIALRIRDHLLWTEGGGDDAV